jgi:hypothetical protein
MRWFFGLFYSTVRSLRTLVRAGAPETAGGSITNNFSRKFTKKSLNGGKLPKPSVNLPFEV